MSLYKVSRRLLMYAKLAEKSTIGSDIGVPEVALFYAAPGVVLWLGEMQ